MSSETSSMSTRAPISLVSVVWKAVECVVNGGAVLPNEWTMSTRLAATSAAPQRATISRRIPRTRPQRAMPVQSGTARPAWKGGTRKRLSWVSSDFWLPWTFLSDDGIGDGEELTHRGDEGDLLRAAGGGQARMEGSDGRVIAHGHQGRHVEHAPRRARRQSFAGRAMCRCRR